LDYRQFGFGPVLVLKKIEKIKIAACNNWENGLAVRAMGLSEISHSELFMAKG
jgi:hypothetical protein